MSDPIEDDRLPSVDELLEISNWSAQLEAARARRAEALRDRDERPPLRVVKPWESAEYLAAEAPPRRAAPVIRPGPALTGTPLVAPARRRRLPAAAAAAGLLVLGGLLSPGIAERMGLRLAGLAPPPAAVVEAALPVEPPRSGALATASPQPAPAAPVAQAPRVGAAVAALPPPAHDAPAPARAAVEPPPGRSAAAHLAAMAPPALRPFVEAAPSRPVTVPPAVLALAVADARPAAAPGTVAAPSRVPVPVRLAALPADALPLVTLRDALPILVFLPDGAATEGSSQALALLRAAGIDAREPGTVGFRVSATHVRHYHLSDRGRAEDVAAAVGGTLRDFTDFRPLPPPGTIELWLAGEPRAAPAPVARVRRVEPRPAAAAAPRFLTAILPDGSRQRMRIIDGSPPAVTRATRPTAAQAVPREPQRRPAAGGNDRGSPAAGGGRAREPAASSGAGGGAVSAPEQGSVRNPSGVERTSGGGNAAAPGDARGNGSGKGGDAGARGGNGRGGDGGNRGGNDNGRGNGNGNGNGGGNGKGNGNGGGNGNGNGNGGGKGRG